LLAATSKSPIKAATTDVREDDFLRLNVAFVSPAKYGDFKRSELSSYYGTSSTALISLGREGLFGLIKTLPPTLKYERDLIVARAIM
jgi:hypothetical protein